MNLEFCTPNGSALADLCEKTCCHYQVPGDYQTGLNHKKSGISGEESQNQLNNVANLQQTTETIGNIRTLEASG